MISHENSLEDYLRRYPRVCAALIAYSLGYATPRAAANILKDAREGRENWCEWIYTCYGCNPQPAVQAAIKARHTLNGYMADYQQALAIVRHASRSGEHPMFASWF